MIKRIVLSATLASSLAFTAGGVAAMDGKSVYNGTCIVCHGSGLAGAPRKGNATDWNPRIAKGIDKLYHSALHGTDKGMPMKGGNHTLTDREVKLAVDFMVDAAKHGGKDDTPADKKAEEVAAQVAKTATVTFASATDINSFNRLLKPAAGRDLPPPEDGIHDPANDGTSVLLPPGDAFAGLPKSTGGNWVNWVAALNEQKIRPRYDRLDPTAEAIVMDLNIVREVKGSMPNVVYPHKQHTQWLDCSNCHPAIFVPQKGANQISMAMILLGQKCGVCHGKVAFPVSECRRCHSQKKDVAAKPGHFGRKEIVRRIAALLAVALVPLWAGAETPSPTPASPKLELVKRLLGDLTAKKRIADSGNAEAQRLIEAATQNCAKAQALVDGNNVSGAEPLLSEALKQITAARRAVADPAPRMSALKVRYSELLDSTLASYASFERRAKESGRDGAEDGELRRIAEIIDSAKTLAAGDQLEPAIAALASAEKNLLAGLNRLLGASTLDYTHRAGTPAEAFEYQLARNRSYAALVPIAIEQMQPGADTVKLIDKNVAENVRLRDQARQQADSRDYESALASIDAGTTLLQRALALAGLVLGPSTGE